MVHCPLRRRFPRQSRPGRLRRGDRGPQGRIVARLSEFLGLQTNNYAEYQACWRSWNGLCEHGAARLRVVSDSELMVKQMKGQYKVASPGLRPLWEEARRRAARLERFEMRHTLRGGNKEADRLANEAMDKGMAKPPGQQRETERRVRSPTAAGCPIQAQDPDSRWLREKRRRSLARRRTA